jgi:hypothetical protein
MVTSREKAVGLTKCKCLTGYANNVQSVVSGEAIYREFNNSFTGQVGNYDFGD